MHVRDVTPQFGYVPDRQQGQGFVGVLEGAQGPLDVC